MCFSYLLIATYSASAVGIARIYNLALGSGISNVPNSSRLSDLLHVDVVLDAFFLHGLLRDFDKNCCQLSVPHSGLQRHRFDDALDKRNYRMAGTGQEMWAHACNKCMYIYQRDDGNWCKDGICKALCLLTIS